ncbi:MAG: gamma-glutamyl-gamma-aminobutyrate hydrolase family protein [Bacillota bacterium]
MQPVIGITCSLDQNTDRSYLAQYYVRAVEAAGGVPVALPALKNLSLIPHHLAGINGLLLSGGVDVDPAFFEEEPWPWGGEITPERDWYEIELVRQALELKMPLLAICRGMQVLNIAAGGSVHQDIGRGIRNPLKHSQQAPRWYPTHRLDIEPGSLLEGILQAESVRVNSFHHQAVKNLAPGFAVTARSSDGVIEAIERIDARFTMGVQFHPECMWERAPKFLELFKALVKACK